MRANMLAELIKISQGSLSDIENGKSDPSAKTILGFILYTDIDLIWMLTGQEGVSEGRIIPEKVPPMIILLSQDVKEVLIRRD